MSTGLDRGASAPPPGAPPPPPDPRVVARMRRFGPTVFAEMSALAARTGAVNLGQGFPDADGPASLLEDAVAAIRSGRNQYPPGTGVPALLEAVAEHQHRFYGLTLDPGTEVLVTAGATEAIAASLLALCGPGDEVVVLEPAYDSYAAVIALSGAVQRSVPLVPGPDGSTLDAQDLRAAFSARTRVVLLNTPHNPTGTVLSPAQVAAVAALAVEHDAVVLTDEVYEHLVFDEHRHVPVATLPGMAERTLTVSSAGKTFSVTGWKVGWVSGPAPLVAAVRMVKQFLTYVNAGPFQPAVAGALALPDDFYLGLAADLQRRRDLLVEGLLSAGFGVSVPAGTYFVVADPRPLGHDDGTALCRELPGLAGVVGVPVSAFCEPGSPAAAAVRPLVRFTFCKSDAVLEEACRRLQALRPR
ncbi:pyridoxal phosphate-dependent aminotransferase [Kineococcus radiotolerans]|uniref:Aminotransferase class I and II n=1 Tax=Kineococcus radiotolerans (strain ATCC BAA-149 / DSM 14245 / SRS30216) TaxID=266940 RepID=A6W7W3_KINRD|nr:pyridoxal phosphate-dependent aminotransferase [Kineococcus radiotolerans]ABS02902.1 aminotransferase class I and II [Kineococcus radiotolerans SRS30216 = ATCC BAA-149]